MSHGRTFPDQGVIEQCILEVYQSPHPSSGSPGPSLNGLIAKHAASALSTLQVKHANPSVSAQSDASPPIGRMRTLTSRKSTGTETQAPAPVASWASALSRPTGAEQARFLGYACYALLFSSVVRPLKKRSEMFIPGARTCDPIRWGQPIPALRSLGASPRWQSAMAASCSRSQFLSRDCL
jgi:hypothetical protein